MDDDKKHVLLAEDNEITRMAFAELIRDAGYRVTEVSNGRQALERLQYFSENVSGELYLLVTDMEMPYITGVELIEEMKRLGIDIPVLAVTAYGDKNMVVRLMRSGCRDYLEKPVDGLALLNAIDHIFERRIEERRTAEKTREHILETESCLADLEKVRNEVNAAVQSYKNLMDMGNSAYKVHSACYSRPLFPIGGDFADIADTPEGCHVLVADVSGHDMGASFHTVLIKSLFNESGRIFGRGEDFFSRLNRHLVTYSKTERMATAVFLNVNLDKMSCEAISAGHPPYIRMKKNREIEIGPELSGDVLGVLDSVEFDAHSFPVESGDRIFLYTDGVVNAGRFIESSGKTQRLSKKGLEALIRKYGENDIVTMTDLIGEAVLRYSGYVLDDDVLLLGIEIP